MGKNLAVFLDRDGTIIEDKGYLSDPELVSFLPWVIPALKLLKKHRFKLVITTNQSGIARKLVSNVQLHLIHKKITTVLAGNNIKLDAIYFCPHHPDENCFCRKPNIGLALRAKRKLNLDLKRSFSIGDKITDVIFAKNFSGKGILVLTGTGKKQELQENPPLSPFFPGLARTGKGGCKGDFLYFPKYPVKPDYTAKSLYDAAKWIVKKVKGKKLKVKMQ